METLKIKKVLQTAFLSGIIALTLVECKKDKLEKQDTPATSVDKYSSLSDFFNVNGVPLQTYTIDGAAGGAFTSPQGTTVTIPPNAFEMSGAPVTGNVRVEFRDIYKKSDMLLSNMPTQTPFGPLKSAGEFFIHAEQIVGDIIMPEIQLAPGKKIIIEQPGMGLPIDTAMAPFVFNKDSLAWKPILAPGFTVAPGGGKVDEIFTTPTSYIYNLYQFTMPASNGTWCNSDNSTYFGAYPQTNLTIHPSANVEINDYGTSVFLVFTGINSMVHVYQNYTDVDFPYQYAPTGLQCTVVAIKVKDDKVYSSFTPITIGTNQTVNFTLTETTTAAFKTALNALN